jgi:hypothetical protein
LRRLREKGQMASKTEMIVIKLYNQDFVAAHTSADGVLQLRLGFEEWSPGVISDTSV